MASPLSTFSVNIKMIRSIKILSLLIWCDVHYSGMSQSWYGTNLCSELMRSAQTNLVWWEPRTPREILASCDCKLLYCLRVSLCNAIRNVMHFNTFCCLLFTIITNVEWNQNCGEVVVPFFAFCYIIISSLIQSTLLSFTWHCSS